MTSDQPAPTGGGCLAVVLVLVGVVMLMPGACGVIMMLAFPQDVFTDFGSALMVAILLLIGAAGIFLIVRAPAIAAPRRPQEPPNSPSDT
jgi:hypothetical protein